ncbi:cytochrome c biogenesis CcdA family protein [Methylobacterium radiotolerans]|uniref:cytochrome c biogenesis CcdA family protein n=1 Tax=Methylobacterium radiotolerans TaxID=31998 RepID=UPI000D5DDFA4|nr:MULTISPECIES: cytochrome c biogenesis protein CcdA [Methylobacterium]MDE3748248.1 sulfite exporter TauE/SafE family protein [Methylobacterium radiotolerans]PVY97765.1 cytochrome c biogenesis protein CcdA [Methylobacterium organophilum]
MLGTVGFAFLAGLLSVLSPCVLPLIPIVLGTAAAEHRLGPVALAAGLAVAFTAIGLFVATIGFTVGLDGDVFRRAGAVLLVLLGAVLMLPRLQARVATAASPIGAWAEDRFGGAGSGGVSGQFAVGLLLGAAWSPCVGPTLGAASLMAARGEHLGGVALTMLAFGIGAAAPLMLLGFVSREALLRWRGGLAAAGRAAKTALGAVMVVLGLLVLTGLDKRVEAAAVAASPDWLNALTTRY